MEGRGWLALGHAFTVRTPDPALDAYLADLFADLPRATHSVAHEYRLEGPDRDRRWVARYDGDVIVEPGDAARALALLLWRINRGVVEDTGDLVLLHAGGVTIDGAAVVLPGDMEVGKTTIVTGLLRAGAGYLSDEAVGLDLDDVLARGYAKALSLDPGSWPLFPELEPEVPAAVRPFLPHQWQIRASTLAGVEVVPEAPVRAVILPRYRAGSPLEVRRLGGADALLRLSGCVFPTGIERRRILRRLARLIREAPCYDLIYSHLPAAVETVAELVRAHTDPVELATSATSTSSADASTGADDRIDERSRFSRRADAALIDLGGEAVIHVTATDELHRVDLIGAALWEQLDGERELGDIIDDLAAGSPAGRELIAGRLSRFVGQLLDLDLLS